MIKLIFLTLAYADLWTEPTKTCSKALQVTSWSALGKVAGSASTLLHAVTYLPKHYKEGFFKGSSRE